MKTTSIKAFFILFGLMLVSNNISAEIGDKLKSIVGSDSSFHIQGLYVIGGIIVASLVMYLLMNHFTKDEPEGRKYRPSSHLTHHKRHQHHKVVKKTA